MKSRLAIPVFVLAVGVLLWGWWTLWFLCDDAFIAFRYVSNSVLGRGYVWNAAPFLPVEGYTSFLWVVVLDVVWRVFGVEPPRSANVLSLLCAVGILALTARQVLRMGLNPRIEKYRIAMLAGVLFGCVVNRTFLTWTSSGLETALFNLLVVSWCFAMMSISNASRTRHYFAIVGLSVLIDLTRPDGLLFLAASIALVVHRLTFGRNLDRIAPVHVAALLPVLVFGAHMSWRRGFYGDWLPNTYQAKFVAAWPEAGARYLLSFVLEYALWIWIAVALALVWRSLARSPWAAWLRGPAPAVAVTTVLAHVSYYTWIIGGDHFEFRVYSYLVPLIFTSLIWMLARLGLSARATLTTMLALGLLSTPIPWTHWARSRPLVTRQETVGMYLPVAPVFPPLLRAYAAGFDRTQAWLISHSICIRHREHVVYHENNARWLPTRAAGLQMRADDFPIIVSGAVGYLAWILPHVAVIDLAGLNDYVIARTPPDPGQERQMAHDRQPPAGYVQSYQPNVRRVDGQPIRFEIVSRPRLLAAEDIVELEHHWRRSVDQRPSGVNSR